MIYYDIFMTWGGTTPSIKENKSEDTEPWYRGSGGLGVVKSSSWELWSGIPTMWGPQTIAKLVPITPITMVYGTYNYSYWGESKPTNITFGGPTLYNSHGKMAHL